MGKHILPLALMFCASAVYSQSKSVSTQADAIQRKALVHQGAVREAEVASIVEDPRQHFERLQIANAVLDRQLALRRDTEKLLSLAAELKQHVDKTGPNILSMDVIKKAQEIEKLAKSVKDKMKDAY